MKKNITNQEMYKEYKSNGFIVLKKALSKDEVIAAKNQCRSCFDKKVKTKWWSSGINEGNCTFKHPELSWLACHPKIIAGVKTVLNSSNNVHFVNVFGIQKNMLSGWHRDDGSGDLEGKNYFESENILSDSCNCVRVAIYLQPHDEFFPGLYVVKGSHLSRKREYGRSFCVPIEIGDVVLFDVRLMHSGTFQNKFVKKVIDASGHKLNKYPIVFFSFLRKIILFFSKTKFSVFLAYGFGNEQTQNYSKNMFKNQLKISGGEDKCSDELISNLKKMNIQVESNQR